MYSQLNFICAYLYSNCTFDGVLMNIDSHLLHKQCCMYSHYDYLIGSAMNNFHKVMRP